MSSLPEFTTVAAELHTLMDWVRWSASQFSRAKLHFGHGTATALDDAAALMLWGVGLPPDLGVVYWSSRLTTEEKLHLWALTRRRVEDRVPMPYITGESYFSGLRFHITPDVLIPRSPIAELIEGAFEPWYEGLEVTRVLDLCTGSGCIGIACAYACPDAEVDLVDISSAAIAVAERNIRDHELDDRVFALQGDLFMPVRGNTYNLIVSNPPYVDAQDMASLPAEFHHEPSLALAAGDDGLDIVRRILREASDYLEPDGLLVCEVGNSEQALVEAYPNVPFVWPEFERGGGGVFVLTAEQLAMYRNEF